MLEKYQKSFKKGVQNSMFFGSKLWKVKNWAENGDFLPAKRFWLSFPENNSDWAEISRWAECGKNVLKRVSKIACFVGPNYGGLKTGWKTTTFYPPNGFGCHFQRITPIELKFNMKQHNTLNNFSCFMAQPLKMLKKYTFLATNWLFVFS